MAQRYSGEHYLVFVFELPDFIWYMLTSMFNLVVFVYFLPYKNGKCEHLYFLEICMECWKPVNLTVETKFLTTSFFCHCLSPTLYLEQNVTNSKRSVNPNEFGECKRTVSLSLCPFKRINDSSKQRI